MNRFLIPGVVLGIALAGPASAGSYYRDLTPAVSTPVGGIIRANGTIERGRGFAVDREEFGLYRITFNKGVFPTGCAAVVVNGEVSGSVLSTAVDANCHTIGPPIVQVRLYDPSNGGRVDASFQFIAVGV
ncbi:MAG: hypothetical protein WAK11_13110 [Candidatus Cybelea sp.]